MERERERDGKIDRQIYRRKKKERKIDRDR